MSSPTASTTPGCTRSALTMTKPREKITLDFNGTDPQAKGPINWPPDEAGGAISDKWLAPMLRSLAATPERAAEIDFNEGVLEVIDVIFPPKGTLITPEGRPAPTRFFLMLRPLGVFAASSPRPPTARCRPTTRPSASGASRHGRDRQVFLFREVLGGGPGGRYWADGTDVVHVVPDSRNLPAEFSETRYPMLVEQLGLTQDSGGAGYRRGGLGYDKHHRALVDCRLISNADRLLLACYGVNGGKAGLLPRHGHRSHAGDRLPACRCEPVLAGQVVRIVTTGGGGWGDPLEREAELVQRDIIDGKVSRSSAREDYGVVLAPETGANSFLVDEPATTALRAKLEAGRATDRPIIDRGEGYRRCSAARWCRGRARLEGKHEQSRTKRMAIEVTKVELKTVQDASGLEACIRQGDSPPTRSSP